MSIFKTHTISRRTLLALTGGTMLLPLFSGCGGSGDSTPSFVQASGLISSIKTLPAETLDLTRRFQHIEPEVSLPGLLAGWSFGEGCGYSFRDLTGHGYEAFINGTHWMTTDSGLTTSIHQPGKRGNAVYLNGSQWLQVQHKPALDISVQTTIAAWIKTDKTPAEMPWQSIVQKLVDNRGFALLLTEQNAVRFSVRDQDGKDHFIDSPEDSVPHNQWVHLLATCDTGNGQLDLYLNGRPIATTHDQTFTAGTNKGDLFIGHSSWLKDAFQGWIDEVVIFDRVLSTTEIRQLYIVGLPQVYRQTRETIDTERKFWTTFKGNVPIPHPLDSETLFSVRFNGNLTSDQNHDPEGEFDLSKVLVPGQFGGAFQALATGPLHYTVPLETDQGTCALWLTPVANENDQVTISSLPQTFVYGKLHHLALSWGKENHVQTPTLVLYLNGVPVARNENITAYTTRFDKKIILGGIHNTPAYGLIDELHIAKTVQSWGSLYPRGHVATEAAMLDFVDRCAHDASEPLVLWQAGISQTAWQYAQKEGQASSWETSLHQPSEQGVHTLFHPDAFGHRSSLEAGLSFGTKKMVGPVFLFKAAANRQRRSVVIVLHSMPGRICSAWKLIRQARLYSPKCFPMIFLLTHKKHTR